MTALTDLEIEDKCFRIGELEKQKTTIRRRFPNTKDAALKDRLIADCEREQAKLRRELGTVTS